MIILDNHNLLDCYYQTRLLTSYLDNLDDYQPTDDYLWLPRGIRSKSILTDKGYRLAIVRCNNQAIHLAVVYLLLYLDKLKAFNHYELLMFLRINNNKYNNIRTTVGQYKLRSILRPSLPYIGMKHKLKRRGTPVL